MYYSLYIHGLVSPFYINYPNVSSGDNLNFIDTALEVNEERLFIST